MMGTCFVSGSAHGFVSVQTASVLTPSTAPLRSGYRVYLATSTFFTGTKIPIRFLKALTDRRGDGADRLAHRFALSREQVMETPHLLAGTVDQIGEQLRELREEYGISYLVVFDEHMEQFAPIVAHLSNQ